MPFAVKLTKSPGDTQVRGCMLASAELKIWEEPSPYGVYVLACDSAFGQNEDSDQSVISVGRCYADRVVQVAEYASRSVQPYQLAWVLAYLAGLYGDVMVILELNNSGMAVFAELKRFKENNRMMPISDADKSLLNALKCMKEYFYKREDTLGGGLLRQWVTSPNNKVHLMERYKTGFETGRCHVRSMQALEEHRHIAREDGNIAGAGKHNDDRVVTLALMYYAYDQWIRIRLSAQGKTFAKETEMERRGGPNVVNTLLNNFMENRGISVPDEVEPDETAV
jgi:hypothetical protein